MLTTPKQMRARAKALREQAAFLEQKASAMDETLVAEATAEMKQRRIFDNPMMGQCVSVARGFNDN
jgi:hypothetical protein